MKQPKIAIVHDNLDQYGGAERVLEAVHEIWPEAPVFTSIYDKTKMEAAGFNDKGWDIRVSFMQNLPFRKAFPKYYFTLFYPFAFRSFNLKGFEVIFSISTYAAKDTNKPKGAIHLCYCNTPPRFLWGFDREINTATMNIVEKAASQIFIPFLRRLDLESSKKVDFFIANSKVVQERIESIYRLGSRVIYPPVDVDRFKKLAKGPVKEAKEPYYLVISRLGYYKKVDIVVEAFNNLGLSLKIIGVGPSLNYLQSIAKSNVEFLGRLPDSLTTFYLQNALALIFPTEEDFGITPVEALSAGKPVIAYMKGGALETLNSSTAKFFYPQTSQALKQAVKNFDQAVYNPITLKKQAEKFSKQRFQNEIRRFVLSVFSDKVVPD